MTEAWELGIAEAAVLIRRRHLSAVELLDAVLDRARATEEYARAWAHIDERGAREAARIADDLAIGGQFAGSLHGIPIGMKDVIDVQGMPTEAGSESLRGNIAPDDAGVVRRLRESGAVILGKLQTHEFAFGQGTPPSRNPWGPDRYAGGSSVGSGVAVAVGSIPGALGTDTGGSVRNPAAINGLVGLKPSYGVASSTGILHVSHTMDHVGPIARSVEDCAALLDGMVEPQGMALLGGPVSAQIRAPLVPVRLGVDRRMWSEWGVTAEVTEAVEGALRVFRDLGFEVVELPLPELDLALHASVAISLSEAAQHHRVRLGSAAERYLPATRIMIETGALASEEDLHLAWQVRAHLRWFLPRAMAQAGVHGLVSPTLPTIAPLAQTMSSELTGSPGEDSLSAALRMLSAANLTGMPGVSIPCGFSNGQPVGLHIMGPEHADARVLAIAQAYERATQWKGFVPVHMLPQTVG
ncbi:glutamyl-tRNA(Gln) amidotransferase subunit A [Arthrobacter sp. StoSoilA2]|uniref:amidase n=1 Tax=unclassified Arthrobacter TaxID=235627 RepID=UPI001CC6FF34|nr:MULTISPECIES: amidase [unclassified Arthrobacter]BCW34803.1 glutamyl-tRNA(Gln) amidotransferase subunit A [Arthrobacter sp. StoSoilA2]BCW52580.1 glutamyl-tRNA(Gln) amidotransferase subunit A [Arthrobacter sp. StoSoilB13]